jgi:Xaa-Pro aminopeptidase
MTLLPVAGEPFAPAVYRDRLGRAAAEAERRGLAALLITPSADYAYLLGYHSGVPSLVLPRLEAPLARHQLGDLADDLQVLPWDETDDPSQLVRGLLEGTTGRVGVQDQMWARFVLRLRAALDPIELVEASPSIAALRRIKDPVEIERLRSAAEAADEAMSQITAEGLAGRTEADISHRISELLLAAGHDTADFAIVGSGPNSASPHHEPGQRVIQRGDAVVLDIGGTRADYCSDTTRTAFVGEPPADFVALYEVLREAQAAACEAVAPGVTAEAVDRAARDVIAEAGYGERFFHRTGHGIGMETHEEPYIVTGNTEPLQVGHAFSVEPGIYIDGQWGARIEDIVICADVGGERLNRSNRELYLVD